MNSTLRSALKACVLWACCALGFALCSPACALAEPLDFEAFERDLLPLVKRHCVKCHHAKEAEGEVDLARFTKVDELLAERQLWHKVVKLIAIRSQREEDFVRHLSSKLLTFALGRGVAYYHRIALDEIVKRTQPDGHRFQDLIREVVLSRPFGMRGSGEDEPLMNAN